MRGWYRANIGGLPGTFWYLWAGFLINKLGGFGVIFLSLYLVQDRGLDTTGAGLVVGLYGAGGCAGVLAGGVLADRWGRRRTLLASHAATTLLLAGLAFAPWIPAIAVLTGLVGAAQSMVGPPLIAAMVDIVPGGQRTKAFNLEFWAFNLGTAIAAPLAGLLAETGFTPLFLVEAGATLVTFVVLAARVPETLPVRAAAARPAGRRRGLLTTLTDRPYLLFVGLTLVLAVLTLQTTTILPLAMAEDHLRPSVYGSVMGFTGIMIVCGQLFVPRLIGGRRKARVLAAANGLIAVGTGLVAVADVVPVYLAAAVVWTIGQMLAAPPNAATIAELSPVELRGRYQAVFYLSFPIAAFVAPALGGASLQRLGGWHWVVCGVLGALAAAGHLLTGPSRERRAAVLREADREPATAA
ncbi:MFS transporter [Actinomadura scrupuli]|uniref:MFS transporter n=1 Tax=Actinomadura scrupuli TaxID=559629 RepID=UPI003D960AFD